MEDQLNLQDVTVVMETTGLMDVYKEYTREQNLSPYFDRPNSIHGIMHSSRVLMLCLISSYYNLLGCDDVDILIKASLFHDIGRTHDGICYEHGRLSFKKMLALELITGEWKEWDEEVEILRYVIENHCIHDKHALSNIRDYRISDQERGKSLLKMFKDCDNLDRVRINDLDPSYLRTPISEKMVRLANQLYAAVR